MCYLSNRLYLLGNTYKIYNRMRIKLSDLLYTSNRKGFNVPFLSSRNASFFYMKGSSDNLLEKGIPAIYNKFYNIIYLKPLNKLFRKTDGKPFYARKHFIFVLYVSKGNIFCMVLDYKTKKMLFRVTAGQLKYKGRRDKISNKSAVHIARYVVSTMFSKFPEYGHLHYRVLFIKPCHWILFAMLRIFRKKFRAVFCDNIVITRLSHNGCRRKRAKRR